MNSTEIRKFFFKVPERNMKILFAFIFAFTYAFMFDETQVMTQPTFTCSKSTIETPERYMKYVQSQQQ